MSYETKEDLIRWVQESIDRPGSRIPEDVAMLRGMSSPKIRHFLNNVCSYGHCRYLEIGTYGGSTLIPAMYENDVDAIAIDNWSQFPASECGGYDARQDLNDRLMKYGGKFKTYEMMNTDCFDAVIPKGTNVFFYDGSHDGPSTFTAIVRYGIRCHQPFILIVDDLELCSSVWEGTQRALNEFTIHKSWELKKKDGYHEGVFVAVVEAMG